MNKCIKEHLVQYCEKKGWPSDDPTLFEVVRESKRIYREEAGQCRWWTDYFYVVEIEGVLIGYMDAETSGDMSAAERGFEFDPSTICEVCAVEKTVIVYEVKK